MNPSEHLAIIGSGASSIYLLKHLLDQTGRFKYHLREISIFEKRSITGMGMPYSPETTDRFNMSNISSEELPELTLSFADWLRDQDPAVLEDLGVETQEISDSEVYSRLALGRYLNSQYQEIIARLAEAGIRIREHPGCEVVDLKDEAGSDQVRLFTATGETLDFDRVVIATGHQWPGDDKPAAGYYASPWPIRKLLPDQGQYHSFPIGTLGASLSAFDVISSLAHRHGTFSRDSGKLVFNPHAGAEQFKIVMHSVEGLLPHLQFDQVEPFREIYRHVDRDGMLALLDDRGFLRLETYFDRVCRPALTKAFQKDGMAEQAAFLADPEFSFRRFAKEMTEEHDYVNAFEGMRCEMAEAKNSVERHKPIHWKEVLDDLMYTLNFHAGLMPAEDHLELQTEVMPFVMNVIAAMPLDSGDIILALHDAGKLDMISGKVKLAENQPDPEQTAIEIEDGDRKSTASYRMFIDCGGQKGLELEDFPFQSLVRNGAVRQARSPFADPAAAEAIPDEKKDRLFRDKGGETFYATGGLDIDDAYRLIGSDGKPNPRIHDIAFPHTSGVRPYSYGLQACSDTSEILVRFWAEERRSRSAEESGPADVTRIYEKL
jgi:uncharacterized NAD(P)/FAD-binding protein YdhS